METTEVLFDLSASHPPEELIEKYAMKRVTESEEEQVEEHLLICGACRDAVVEAESWVPMMKHALTAAPAAKPVAGWQWRLPTFRNPVWGLGAAALAAALVAVPYATFRQNEPIAVALEAFRGAEAPVEVPAGTPLRIRFAHLEGTNTITVVDAANGSAVWSGAAENGETPPLAKGRYWVRVIDRDGRQTKEAGLLVR